MFVTDFKKAFVTSYRQYLSHVNEDNYSWDSVESVSSWRLLQKFFSTLTMQMLISVFCIEISETIIRILQHVLNSKDCFKFHLVVHVKGLYWHLNWKYKRLRSLNRMLHLLGVFRNDHQWYIREFTFSVCFSCFTILFFICGKTKSWLSVRYGHLFVKRKLIKQETLQKEDQNLNIQSLMNNEFN